FAAAWHDIENTRWQTCFFNTLGEEIRVHRRFRRRFRNHRATRGKCGRNLVAEQYHRRIPWRDRRDYANRLADNARDLSIITLAFVDHWIGLDHLAVELEQPRCLH